VVIASPHSKPFVIARARRPRTAEDHLAIHHREGAASISLQTAEH